MVSKYEGYSFDNEGFPRYNNRIYVSANDELRSLILREAHRPIYMAHTGVTKMKTDLKILFF
jgi:hypothetical protein